MNRVCATLAVLALVLVATFPSAALAGQDEERVSRVVPIAAGGTLKLKNFSGRVTITAADRTDVAIEAVRRAPRDRLARIALDIQATGRDVMIEANRKTSAWQESDKENVVETAFDILVPRDVVLDIDVFSSPVTVAGVQGSMAIKTFSADVVLRDVVAPTIAKTFSGAIQIDWAPSVVTPEATAETFSGDIELRLPPAASGRLDFSTFSGKIENSLPLTLGTRDRRGLEATLGRGGSNQLKLKTFSGDVTVR